MSTVRRSSTPRQFHYWRGPSEFVWRSSANTTKTRSARGTSWNVCEKRLVHSWDRPVGKPHAHRIARRPATTEKNSALVCCRREDEVKEAGCDSMTGDTMNKTREKLPWVSCVECDMASRILLTSTATAVVYNHSCEARCCW